MNKKEIEEKYDELLSFENLKGIDNVRALTLVGMLVDLSLDLSKIEGIGKALGLLEEIENRNLTPTQKTYFYYIVANAWSNKKQLFRKGTKRTWEWEQVEIEKEILNYRKAIQSEGFKESKKRMKCQILTNLANSFSNIGRFGEAVELWDKTLDIDSEFTVAIGNKGHGLTKYAQCLYDSGHVFVFLKLALNLLEKAISKDDIHPGAKKRVQSRIKWISEKTTQDFWDKEINLEGFSLGDSDSEIKYKEWCLKNKLFLNPLNDLGAYSIGARDILNLPSIVRDIDEGPDYLGFFNQMKQEFVSARFLYYEGLKANKSHFSDKDVFLYNTLDYPAYSLFVEKVKMAYRVFYSLFDKIAYLLQDYFDFREEYIFFKTLWYKGQKRNKGLRECFKVRKNWALRGLFWLSKDLYEDSPGFRDYIEPEAKNLYKIRNRLEHRYLKLHNSDWIGKPYGEEKMDDPLVDNLAYSLYRVDFEEKTLKLMKMVRASLIYLSLSINLEEKIKAKDREDDIIIPGMSLDKYEDEWKI